MNTHGFTLMREESMREAGGVVRLWKHDVTGAELLSDESVKRAYLGG